MLLKVYIDFIIYFLAVQPGISVAASFPNAMRRILRNESFSPLAKLPQSWSSVETDC